MNFWIKDFHLQKSFLSKRRSVVFCYFNAYKWKKLKIQLPLSYNADMSFYTNLMLNGIREDLEAEKLYSEYVKVIPFIEQLNRALLSSATKLGR